MKAIAYFLKFTICFIIWMMVFFGGTFFYLKTHINDGSVEATFYEVSSPKINNKIRIVQISDLHDFSNIDGIFQQTKAANPDLIVTTGDMFDSNRPDLENTVSLYEKLINIGCPIYYTPGNHELGKAELLSTLKEKLEALGVKVLVNGSNTETINGQKINVIAFDNNTKYSATKMSEINVDDGNFTAVLCHFPENFDKILENKELYYGSDVFDMNLILSGHAHGGQIRFRNQGLYSPNQGYFPKWTNGIHQLTESEYLVVNRGLGNSTFPIRINNPSEIVVVNVEPE